MDIEKPRKQRTQTVTIKKTWFVDGELKANQGAQIEVTTDELKQLKASRLIDEVH